MTKQILRNSRPLHLIAAVGLAATSIFASLNPVEADPVFSTANPLQSQKLIVLAQAKTDEKKKPAKKKANPWKVQCGTDKKTNKKFCRIQQSLRYKKTGQRLLAVIIQPQPIEPNIAILLSLPHGLYLPAGTAYKVDDGKENRLVIETCDVEGCYATGGITEEMAEAMRNGKKLLIGFQASNKKPITIPVSLAGFTAAFKKIQQSK